VVGVDPSAVFVGGVRLDRWRWGGRVPGGAPFWAGDPPAKKAQYRQRCPTYLLQNNRKLTHDFLTI
jgi:hypothetical protein